MTTITASVVTAYNEGNQELWTIDYPFIDTHGLSITGVSKANPAVVTSTIPLPALLTTGSRVLITGVGGMVELATAGYNGSSVFYITVLSSTTFSLYSDSALNNGVDSTGFTTATANTGIYNTYTVPQYVSGGKNIPLTFNTTETNVGTDVAIDNTTGEITLQSGITYQLIARAYITGNQTGTYQFLDESTGLPISVSCPIGNTLVATITPNAETTYQLIGTCTNGEWIYPTEFTNATLSVQAISGYTVA